MTTSPKETKAEIQAKIRDDLIRRLFAVAISIGAAATLSNMGWVTYGRWPCLPEWQQLFVLVAAMTATVLSWDGYLYSIHTRPLRDFCRFAIDILLVFIYMILLMTSKLLVWWVFLHAFIFFLYAVWDYRSVRDWPERYYDDETTKSVGGVYIGGICDSPGVSKGPIITLVWAAYFWLLFFLTHGVLRERIVIVFVLIMLGLGMYRRDKDKRYPFWKRIAYVVALSAISYAAIRYGFIDSSLWAKAGPYIGSASCAS